MFAGLYLWYVCAGESQISYLFRSKKAKRHVLGPVATFHHQKACANG